MDLKPTKGLKVRVGASREAVFGDEGVEIRRVSLQDDKCSGGILTGAALAGFCEVEMPGLDGQRHWYPIDGLRGENGERIIEDEIMIEVEEDYPSEEE